MCLIYIWQQVQRCLFLLQYRKCVTSALSYCEWMGIYCLQRWNGPQFFQCFGLDVDRATRRSVFYEEAAEKSSVGVARHEESLAVSVFSRIWRKVLTSWIHTNPLPPSQHVTGIMLQTSPLLSSSLFQIWLRRKRVAVATTSQRQLGLWWGRERALWVTETNLYSAAQCCRAHMLNTKRHRLDKIVPKWWWKYSIFSKIK